jgi:hypothetical protein
MSAVTFYDTDASVPSLWNGKQEYKILLKWCFTCLTKLLTKSIPTISQGDFARTSRGYKEEVTCRIGLVQLQTIQLKQSNNINTLPPETFSYSCQHALPILMVNIIMTFNQQQDIHILCRTGHNQPIMVGIQSVQLLHSMTFPTCLCSSNN